MEYSVITARFFDGESALEHVVTVGFDLEGLSIRSDNNQEQQWFWYYRDVLLVSQSQEEFRLGNGKIEDAILILPHGAEDKINNRMPDLLSGRVQRRRMTGLVIGLVSISALITAGLFVGIPAASGPLARMTPKDYEITMGENFAAQINTFIKPCANADEALSLIEPVINRMAVSGNVGFPIEFQFVRMGTPNAFALPGGQVMATKGLLRVVEDDQEAFMAVIAHELGHVRARDGMQAFYRNAGLGILLEVITGGSGLAQQSIQLSGQINQMRHSRIQESRADETAFEILNEVGINPEALARAFEDITRKVQEREDADSTEEIIQIEKKKKKRRIKIPGWLNSHPNTSNRIKDARAASTPSTTKLFTDKEWTVIQQACATPEPDGVDD